MEVLTLACGIVSEEVLERDAASKALMSVLRQDTKGIRNFNFCTY